MADQYVTVDRRPDGVAVLRLDRPKMNALSSDLLRQLEQAARGLTEDPPGAVVVWGGERVFAAGADITEFAGPAEAEEIGGVFLSSLEALAAVPRVVIAAVAGYALGGGCELSLACDFRMAGESATFGQPEILLGIIPGGGGTQRLTRLVGPARSKEIILSGRQVPAAEALSIGLADRVVPDGELLDEALAWAAGFAAGPVVAQGMVKRAVDEGLDGPLAEGLRLEQRLFAQVFATEDAKIGVASFLEQGPGKASFVGR
ncbi:MAG TPA: enoyl-CoA hydratase-related protein [Acidimicrobiales bacterium]|jgi:enoyl-CoA hydratase|nr:enoyl-CoA hydratase-related protein [Acidimicrobiales bacterium]